MRADGDQLRQIAVLLESGVITPVIDTVGTFEDTTKAISQVESARTKGKVVQLA